MLLLALFVAAIILVAVVFVTVELQSRRIVRAIDTAVEKAKEAAAEFVVDLETEREDWLADWPDRIIRSVRLAELERAQWLENGGPEESPPEEEWRHYEVGSLSPRQVGLRKDASIQHWYLWENPRRGKASAAKPREKRIRRVRPPHRTYCESLAEEEA